MILETSVLQRDFFDSYSTVKCCCHETRIRWTCLGRYVLHGFPLLGGLESGDLSHLIGLCGGYCLSKASHLFLLKHCEDMQCTDQNLPLLFSVSVLFNLWKVLIL